MKLSIRKEYFESALEKVECGIDVKKKENPKGILIEAQKDKLRLVTNKAQVGAAIAVDTCDDLTIEEDGKICIESGDTFIKSIKSCHTGVLMNLSVTSEKQESKETGEMEDVSLLLISYKSKTGKSWEHKFALMSDKKAPSRKFGIKGHELNMPTKLFNDFINRTAFAAGENPHNKAFSSGCVDFSPKGTAFVATDGRKLAYITDLTAKTKVKTRALIEVGVLNAFTKIFDGEGDINIVIEDNKDEDVNPQVKFTYKNFEAVTSLVDGQFPAYEKITEDKNSHCSFVINTKTLEEDISALYTDEGQVLMFHFGEDETTVEHTSFCKKKSKGILSGISCYDGEPADVILSKEYWDLLFKICEDEDVHCRISSPNKPLEFSMAKGNYKYYAMPIIKKNED